MCGMEQNITIVTAFAGDRLFASGQPAEVALALKAAAAMPGDVPLLAFDDRSGRQVDFDLSGTDAEIVARLAPAQDGADPGEAAVRRGAGRPKLGVVAREVTLLPRHWQWLAEQPGGASVTLRKLVDAARAADAGKAAARTAQQAADRFMAAMLGNRLGYEEAARALYAGNRDRFLAVSEPWPADLRDHARRLAEPAFG
ncbi:MAG: DUF2239 family protein [Mesorhizobium sp.]